MGGLYEHFHRQEKPKTKSDSKEHFIGPNVRNLHEAISALFNGRIYEYGATGIDVITRARMMPGLLSNGNSRHHIMLKRAQAGEQEPLSA